MVFTRWFRFVGALRADYFGFNVDGDELGAGVRHVRARAVPLAQGVGDLHAHPRRARPLLELRHGLSLQPRAEVALHDGAPSRRRRHVHAATPSRASTAASSARARTSSTASISRPRVLGELPRERDRLRRRRRRLRAVGRDAPPRLRPRSARAHPVVALRRPRSGAGDRHRRPRRAATAAPSRWRPSST